MNNNEKHRQIMKTNEHNENHLQNKKRSMKHHEKHLENN